MKNVIEVVVGKGEVFKFLKDVCNDFEKCWNILVNGDESIFLLFSFEVVKL